LLWKTFWSFGIVDCRFAPCTAAVAVGKRHNSSTSP
jgi:hypothetical protein